MKELNFRCNQLGQLYLYGINEDCNVIDLSKAKKHLLNAARFARAEASFDSSFNRLAAESFLHASIAVYAMSGEPENLNLSGKVNSLIQEATELAQRSIGIYSDLSEAHYHVAKYNALMAHKDRAILSLERSILLDRHYAVKVDIDEAFMAIRQEVYSLLTRLHDIEQKKAANGLSSASASLEEGLGWHPEKSPANSHLFEEAKVYFDQAKKDYSSGVYFGHLDCNSKCEMAKKKVGEFISSRIRELREQIETVTKQAQTLLDSKNRFPENAAQFDRANVLLGEISLLLSQENYRAFERALALAQEASNLSKTINDIANNARAKQVERDRRAALTNKRMEIAGKAFIHALGLGLIFSLPGGLVGCMVKTAQDTTMRLTIGDATSNQGWLIGFVIGAIIGTLWGLVEIADARIDGSNR